MKKTIAILLSVVIILLASGCGNLSKRETALTEKNLSDYLQISIEFTNQHKNVIADWISEATMIINIMPIQNVSFNRVQLILAVDLGSSVDAWEVSSSDSAYKYSFSTLDNEECNNYLITKITLPVDGNYSEEHSITKSFALKELENFIYQPISENGCIPSYMVTNDIPEGTQMITGTVERN